MVRGATQEQIDGMQHLINRCDSDKILTQAMMDNALATFRDADGWPPGRECEANVTPASYNEDLAAGKTEYESLHCNLQDGFVAHIGARCAMPYPKSAFGDSANPKAPAVDQTVGFQRDTNNPLDNILAPKPGFDNSGEGVV